MILFYLKQLITPPFEATIDLISLNDGLSSDLCISKVPPKRSPINGSGLSNPLDLAISERRFAK